MHGLRVRLWSSVLLGTLTLVVTGCPAMTDGPQTVLTPGSWSHLHNMTGTYEVRSGLCAGDLQELKLNKP